LEECVSAIEHVLSRLERVRKVGRSWYALCPVHDDRTPSLKIDLGDDGRVLLSCKVGCPNRAIIEEAGLEWKDLYEDSHSPRRPFAPKRVHRSTESSSPPLARQQIEDDHDAGLSSFAAYMAELIAWSLSLPSPAVYTRYQPIESPEYVSKDEADYFGPGDEPRKLRPPLAREDFSTEEEFQSYESWLGVLAK
jgi:hypothetical protein